LGCTLPTSLRKLNASLHNDVAPVKAYVESHASCKTDQPQGPTTHGDCKSDKQIVVGHRAATGCGEPSMTPQRNQVLQGLLRARYWPTGVIVQQHMTVFLHARRIPRSVRTTGETLSRTRQSSRYLSEIQMDRSGRRLCGDGGTMPPDLRVR
jgi:hypothetical protein